MRSLIIALGNSGLTKPLKDGRIKSNRLELKHADIEAIVPAMRRMVRNLDFDICEMAFTTYLCAKAYGKPITAIPVFVTRNFHHWAAFCSVRSGIREPKDLEGRRVGVNRGYTVTTGLWVRGILQTEYGLNLNKVTWMPTADEHVAEYQPPPNVDYALVGKPLPDLLLAGEVDAAVGDVRADSTSIRPLIPNASDAGFAYYRKTGIYPINHGVVIKNSLLESEPWLAEELFNMFKASKEIYLKDLEAGAGLAAADGAIVVLKSVVGDPFPVGIAPNRKSLETIVDFAVDQKVISRKYAIEDLFTAGADKLA